jgi:alpha-L-fucosidase
MEIARRDFIASALAGAAAVPFGPSAFAQARALPVPTKAQREWADMELGMFYHFDIPVYTPGWNWRSWKNLPRPNLYNPSRLDTDQWMEAAKAYGAKYVVFVAKHCSGFLQWQSDLYAYGLKQSAWRGGTGDVVKLFVDSARRYGLKPGLYASVSANAFLQVDRGYVNRGRGGDAAAQRRYAAICERMCEELWSRYGDLFEIWFDGGALPPAKGGTDLMPRIGKYQPNALIFQGPAEATNLIRWVGNERGIAPYPCWSTGWSGTSSDGTKESRYSGDPDGNRWIPGECDVPLGNGKWFCTERVRQPYWSMDYLVKMYDRSVGRNCNLLLNAAPQPDGLIAEREMKIYAEFGRRIKGRYANRLGETAGEGMRLDLALAKDAGPVNQVVVAERIEDGERVRKFTVEALTGETWRTLYTGSCIGHKHLIRFEKTRAARLRLSVQSAAATPRIREFSAFCN